MTPMAPLDPAATADLPWIWCGSGVPIQRGTDVWLPCDAGSDRQWVHVDLVTMRRTLVQTTAPHDGTLLLGALPHPDGGVVVLGGKDLVHLTPQHSLVRVATTPPHPRLPGYLNVLNHPPVGFAWVRGSYELVFRNPEHRDQAMVRARLDSGGTWRIGHLPIPPAMADHTAYPLLVRRENDQWSTSWLHIPTQRNTPYVRVSLQTYAEDGTPIRSPQTLDAAVVPVGTEETSTDALVIRQSTAGDLWEIQHPFWDAGGNSFPGWLRSSKQLPWRFLGENWEADALPPAARWRLGEILLPRYLAVVQEDGLALGTIAARWDYALHVMPTRTTTPEILHLVEVDSSLHIAPVEVAPEAGPAVASARGAGGLSQIHVFALPANADGAPAGVSAGYVLLSPHFRYARLNADLRRIDAPSLWRRLGWALSWDYRTRVCGEEKPGWRILALVWMLGLAPVGLGVARQGWAPAPSRRRNLPLGGALLVLAITLGLAWTWWQLLAGCF